MSRLKELLRVSGPSTCNTQQTPVQACTTLAQHAHNAQQAALDESFEERAGIMEFEGGLTREEAERVALSNVTAGRSTNGDGTI
jgi:hypothetical protein